MENTQQQQQDNNNDNDSSNYDIENPSPSSLNSIELSNNNNSNNSKDYDEEEISSTTTTTNKSSSTSSNKSSKSSSSSMWTLRVMSFQNVEIQIASNSTISQLKGVVRRALGGTANNSQQQQSLRLICKGRLLTPDESQITEFKVQNGDVLHAVLAKQQVAATESTITTSSGNRRRRRNNRNNRRNHQIVGPGGRVTRAPSSSGDDDDSSTSSYDTGDEESSSSPRLGLDRLLRRRDNRNNSNNNSNGNTSSVVGLSRQDVAVLRTYFSRQIDRHASTHNQHLDEPDLSRRRLLIEEDWMAVQGPASEFRLNLNSSLLASNMLRSLAGGSGRNNNNNNDPFGGNPASPFTRGHIGNDRDFAWGFLLGFFVGFVMLVWVWMPTVPHKQKLGILTGISFQLALQVLNEDQEEPDEFVTSSSGAGAGLGVSPP